MNLFSMNSNSNMCKLLALMSALLTSVGLHAQIDELETEGLTNDQKQLLWEADQQENFKQYYGAEKGIDLDLHDERAAPPPREADFDDPAIKRWRPDTTHRVKAIDIPQPKMTIRGDPVFDSIPGIPPSDSSKANWFRQFEAWKRRNASRGTYSEKRTLVRAGDVTKGITAATRLEIRELNVNDSLERKVFANSRGVLGMIMDRGLTDRFDEKVEVDTASKLGPTYGLCRDEPYWSEPSSCFCTAFLIADDLAITARHCIDYMPLANIRMILGFELADKVKHPDYLIRRADVFQPIEVVGGSDMQTLDFVILKLDHKASLLKYLPISSVPASTADSVYAIGYPSGLPMKVAGIGQVTRTEDNVFFYSNIDTYQGNSGSPVFNSRTHEVMGILIEGDQDFENRGNCKGSRPCYGNNCEGEKAISSTQLLPYINSAKNQ